MNSLYKYTIVGVLALFTLTAHAQDVNTDVRVVREYAPVISDANKIDAQPSQESLEEEAKPTFSYTIVSKPLKTPGDIAPITPAKVKIDRSEMLYKSYAKAGIGNYNTLFGELDYNIAHSDKYGLALNVGHLSSFGKVKLENDEKVKAPFSDTWAALNFQRFYKKYTFKSDITFTNNAYNYYGLTTVDPSLMYQTMDGSSVLGGDLLPEDKQHYTNVGLQFSLDNSSHKRATMPFVADGGLNYLSTKTGVSEFGLNLGGRTKYNFDGFTVGADALFKIYNSSVPDASQLYLFESRNNGVFQFSPYASTHIQGVDLRAGVDVYAEMGFDDAKVRFAPNVMISSVIADDVVQVYAGVKGDYKMNNLQTVLQENAFVSMDENIKNAFYGLNFMAGLEGKFSDKLSFLAGVEFSTFKDEHFFVNRAFVPQTPGEELAQSSLFTVDYSDGTLLDLGAEFKYEHNEKMEFQLNANYYAWGVDSLPTAYHKAPYEIVLSGNFEVYTDVWVNASFTTLGARKALDVASAEEKTLPAVYDLSIEGVYEWSSRWTIFGSLNNMFASKYYIYNGYPLQGFNVRAGLGYAF